MCSWNAKKGWTKAVALKGTKVCWLQKKCWMQNRMLNQKEYIEHRFMRWIELKIDSLNWNIHLLNIATIGLPYQA